MGCREHSFLEVDKEVFKIKRRSTLRCVVGRSFAAFGGSYAPGTSNVHVLVHVSVVTCILVWIHVCVAPPIVVGLWWRGHYASFLSIIIMEVAVNEV